MSEPHPVQSCLSGELARVPQRHLLRTAGLQSLLLGGVILLGAALRFYGLGDRSLWGDEINTAVLFVTKPLSYIVTHFHPNNHTLFSLLAHVFTRQGAGEYVLRMPAALFGIASIAALYRLGKVAFNPGTGLIAAFLLAVSPLHLTYSQEARGYSGVVFFSALSASYLFQAIERGQRRAVVAFVLTTTLLLYTHLFSILLLAAELCVLGGYLVYERLSHTRRGTMDRSQVRSWVVGLLLLTVLLAILYAPLWLSLLSIIDTSHAGDYAGALSYSTDWRLDAASLLKLFLQYAGSRTGRWQGLSVISLAFFMVGLLLSVARRPKRGLALAALLALPFLGVAVLDKLLGGFFAYSRFFIFLLPVYLVLAAYGIMSVGQLVGYLGGRRLGARLPAWGSSLLLAVGLLGGLSVSPLRQVYATEYQGWRAVGQYLAQHTRSNDLVIQIWQLQPNSLGWYYHPSDPTIQVYQAKVLLQEPIRLSPGSQVWWVVVHNGRTQQLEKEIGEEFDAVTFPWLAVLHRRGEPLTSEEAIDATVTLSELQASLSPEDRASYENLADGLLRKGGVEQALFYARQGDAEAGQRAWAQSLASYKRALRCWPEWGQAQTKAGNAYRALGQLTDAEEAYRNSIRVEPGYVGAYINLADILLAQDRSEEALALYVQATEIAPDSAWAHSALGSAHLRLGAVEEGMAHLRYAVELEPNNVTWLLALADGYRELGRDSDARGIYQQVLVLDPANLRAAEALEALQP